LTEVDVEIEGDEAVDSGFGKLNERNAPGRQAVFLYEEQDLSIAPVHDVPFRQPSLLMKLQAMSHADDRVRVVRHVLGGLGFEWMVYGTVARERQSLYPRAFLATYANRSLLHRYFSRRHHDVDPFFQGDTSTTLPNAWTVDELAEHRSLRNRRGMAYLADLTKSGVVSGLSFDVPGSHQHNERAIISLLSCRRGADAIDDRVMQGALSLACCMHHLLAYRALVRRRTTPSSRQILSPRQLEILDLLALGNSDRRIAEQLGLTGYAIDYHMRQLRRHFGVQNRLQLINAASAAAICPPQRDRY